MKPRAVVLLSGGIDSSVALAFAKAEGNDVYALSIDYGQRHGAELWAAGEQSRLQRTAAHVLLQTHLKYLGSPLLTGAVPRGPAPVGLAPTYVPARNTLFLTLALGYAEVIGADDVYVGANADDQEGYPDCRLEFFRAFEVCARLATVAGVKGRPFRIRTPLISMRKNEIVKLALSLGVQLQSTLSCYAPESGKSCGQCAACRLRLAAFASNGVTDPVDYVSG